MRAPCVPPQAASWLFYDLSTCVAEHLRDQRRTRVPPPPARTARPLPAPPDRPRARDDACRGRVRQGARENRRLHDYRASPCAHRRRLGRPGLELLQAGRQVPRRPPGAPGCHRRRYFASLSCAYSLRLASDRAYASNPGHPRFFLGSDSAPHPTQSKSVCTPTQACAAGVYTSPILLPLCAHLLESFGALNKLENFVGGFGRRFYRREAGAAVKVTLEKVEGDIVPEIWEMGEEKVGQFMAGKALGWKIAKGA